MKNRKKIPSPGKKRKTFFFFNSNLVLKKWDRPLLKSPVLKEKEKDGPHKKQKSPPGCGGFLKESKKFVSFYFFFFAFPFWPPWFFFFFTLSPPPLFFLTENPVFFVFFFSKSFFFFRKRNLRVFELTTLAPAREKKNRPAFKKLFFLFPPSKKKILFL